MPSSTANPSESGGLGSSTALGVVALSPRVLPFATAKLALVFDEVVTHVALLARAVGVELGSLVLAPEVVRGANAGVGFGGTLTVVLGIAGAASTSDRSASVRWSSASSFGTKRIAEAVSPVDACLSEMSVEASLTGDGGEITRDSLGDVDELEVDEEELERHVPRVAKAADREVDGLVDKACGDERVGGARRMAYHDP